VQAFTSLYWIARVPSDGTADGPVIVALGDSITRGDGTSADGEQRYPDHLQARLLAENRPGAVVLNAGIGGNRVLRPQVGPPMTERFDRDCPACSANRGPPPVRSSTGCSASPAAPPSAAYSRYSAP
jgi:hypothetical protein